MVLEWHLEVIRGTFLVHATDDPHVAQDQLLARRIGDLRVLGHPAC